MFSHRYPFILPSSVLDAQPIASHAHPRYAVTIVGAPGSIATGINNSGTVIGDVPVGMYTHGFFTDTAGVITPLAPTSPYVSLFVSGINDTGNIVGTQIDNSDGRSAFLYDTTGAIIPLGTLGGLNSDASAINNRGDIVGWAQIAGGMGLDTRAFLLRPGVSMQDLGRFEVPNPEGDSHALGINEHRQVVGGSVRGPYMPPESPYHAFLYACEEMMDLGTLGGQFSIAYGINDRGQIVGEASTSTFRNNRAFLYDDGVMQNLGTLVDGEFSSARAINLVGQVVGRASGSTGGSGWEKAFLFDASHMLDLDELIEPAGVWSLSSADGINDSGQIAATGCTAGICYALRLDPVY